MRGYKFVIITLLAIVLGVARRRNKHESDGNDEGIDEAMKTKTSKPQKIFF